MTIVQNSIFIRFLLQIWPGITTAWNSCVFMRFCRAVALLWSRWWNGSAVMRFVFHRDGLLPRVWAESRFCHLLTVLINLPADLLHRLYQKFKPAFDNSFFASIAYAMGDHVPVAIGWFMLLVLNIPHGRWSNSYSFAGYLLIFLLVIAGGMRRRSLRVSFAHIGPYTLLFFLAVFLSWPLSMHPSLSFRFLFYYFPCALCVLLVVSSIENADQLERLAGFTSLGLAGMSAYGISQRLGGLEIKSVFVDSTLNEGIPARVYSFYDNPNSFAQVLVLLMPIAVGLLFGAKRKVWRVVGLGSALLGAISIIMTYSRASWIGLVVAALIFLFFWNRKLIPVCIVAGLACIPILPDSVLTRILTIFNPNDTSTSSRFPLYQAALRMIAASPVTGAGLGPFAVKAAVAERNIYDMFAFYAHCHNFYLQTWLEIGLLGILSLVAAMFSSFKQGAKAVCARIAPASVRLIILGAMSGLAGVLVCGLADYLWTYPRVMLIFWFSAAILLAGLKLAKQEAEV